MGVFAIYFSDDYSCFSVDFVNKIWSVRNFAYLCNPETKVRGVLRNGVIAQLVEQRTENPCVPGSIPGDTTLKIRELQKCDSLFLSSGHHQMAGKWGSVFMILRISFAKYTIYGYVGKINAFDL